MQFLFTYGTLQDKQVQHYVFGRVLKGTQDTLTHFRWFENAVYGRYPLVRFSGNKDDEVVGVVYEVNQDDLQVCDVYETSAYQRELFELKSGVNAWVYVEKSD